MAPLLNTALSIFGALLLVFILKNAADAKKVLDINDKVKNFVKKMEKQHNTKVSWWDMHGKSTKLLNKDGNKKYHVWAKANPMHYGERSSGKKIPNTVYVMRFHNEQPAHSQKAIFKRTTIRKQHASWHSTKSIRIGVDVRASVSLSGIFAFKAGFDYNYDLTSGESYMATDSEEFTIQKEITIPPRTTVEVEWIVTEHVHRIPWESEVLIDGWFLMWFEKQVHNHHLWYHPIDVISDPDLKLHEPSGLAWNATGFAEGVTMIRSELRVRECDLVAKTWASSNTTTYTIPLTERDIVTRTVDRTSPANAK